jgi:glutamate synthase domain-containing protein 1
MIRSGFHDSCGFALLAHMDGEKSHWLVRTTLESLARLTTGGRGGRRQVR